MQIQKIHVTAGRGFNHPFEQFANFRFDLHLEAVLSPGEHPGEALVELQAEAEAAAESHKRRILADIERLELIKQGEYEIERLKRRANESEQVAAELQKAQDTLAKLRGMGPLMLAGKQVHPGHPDHPETDSWDNSEESLAD